MKEEKEEKRETAKLSVLVRTRDLSIRSPTHVTRATTAAQESL